MMRTLRLGLVALATPARGSTSPPTTVRAVIEVLVAAWAPVNVLLGVCPVVGHLTRVRGHDPEMARIALLPVVSSAKPPRPRCGPCSRSRWPLQQRQRLEEACGTHAHSACFRSAPPTSRAQRNHRCCLHRLTTVTPLRRGGVRASVAVWEWRTPFALARPCTARVPSTGRR